MRKKNKTMRAAGALFLATMLTTSMTAGTFAKYTTGDSASDSARVAKFGVVVQADGTLFGKYYADTIDETNNKPTAINNPTTVSVAAYDASSKLVAPGTQSDAGLGFGLKGSPEVDVTVKATISSKSIRLEKGNYGVMVDVTGTVTKENFTSFSGYDPQKYYRISGGNYVPLNGADTFDEVVGTATAGKVYELHDFVYNNATYYPVVYSLSGDTILTSDVTSNSADVMAGMIANKLNGDSVAKVDGKYVVSKSYNANTDLASLGISSEKLEWKWDFDNFGAGTYDGQDTILGDMVAKFVTGDFNDTIVYNTSTSSDNTSFEEVVASKVDRTNTGIDDNTTYPVACLFTNFDINISVTQED